jgi:arginine deiminase
MKPIIEKAIDNKPQSKEVSILFPLLQPLTTAIHEKKPEAIITENIFLKPAIDEIKKNESQITTVLESIGDTISSMVGGGGGGVQMEEGSLMDVMMGIAVIGVGIYVAYQYILK